ncbi:HemX family protein [Fervidibacillus halotolerans]|uniref:HemX family protein n=1 Tax=Fervidibacillus halotolerans TaxID=2980027 RepID=A0A9E8LYH3_9BACI|nr:HemX family protein [Fervidibacillus halotolerans]WAA11600.1 HemX family protein [Fervidibacillus halotolerans]
MGEQILLRLHEWMLILYALSICFYFYDFLFHSRRANRFAYIFLFAVWLVQTSLLIVYMNTLNRFPILTIYEGIYFYVWVLITLSLFVNRYLNIPFLVFFTNVFGFILIVIFSAAPFRWSSNVLAEGFASDALFLHITLSLMAYASFSVSSMFSILYS